MAGPFDFAALQNALNDPSIKAMAEQIATDPSFKEMTEKLQESMGAMMGGMGGAPGANPFAGGMPPANFDPSKYMSAMGSMFSNPSFMQMAEKLGKAIIESDPQMATMMQSMQDPSTKSKMEDTLKGLKDDPALGPMLAELESGGPMAMMKYWNDPEVLAKLGAAMGDALDLPGAGAEGQEGEEEEEEESVHAAATNGNVDMLKRLVEAQADVNEADEEGRTALHFAAGYGELECCRVLLAAGAKLDAVDSNKNTALHYAAGYGQVESVKLLLEKGADKSVKNMDGKTALEVATLNEQADVAAALA